MNDLGEITKMATTGPYGGDYTLSSNTVCLLLCTLRCADYRGQWTNFGQKLFDSEWDQAEKIRDQAYCELLGDCGNPLLDGLVSFYELNEQNGSRQDVHGTNDLIDMNTVGYATGIIDNAANFVASEEEYLICNSNPSLQLGDISFSFAFWINFSSIIDKSRIFTKDHEYHTDRELICHLRDTGKIRFTVFSDGQSPVHLESYDTVVSGNWYFVVIWFDGDAGETNIQINNGTISSISHSGGVYVGDNPFIIGSQSNLGKYLNAKVDNFGFWKRVLDSTERSQLYNSGNGLAYPFT